MRIIEKNCNNNESQKISMLPKPVSFYSGVKCDPDVFS